MAGNNDRLLVSEAARNFKNHGNYKAIDPKDIHAIKIMKDDHFDIGYDPN